MTGLETSPATTLGNAPSMPATTTSTLARRMFSDLASNRCRPGHADVVNPFDAVAHDFRRDRRFLGHGQITRAGANDADGSGTFGQGFFLDGHAAGKRVMDGALEFFAQGAGMAVGDARDEHALFGRQNFGGDFDHLFRRFARAENDFGKTFAQRAVRVHLRETEVGHRRGLKCAQDFVARTSFRRGIFPAVEWLQSVVTHDDLRCHRNARHWSRRKKLQW